MGIIRGGLLVLTSVLLLISFLAGNIFLTMDLSLDYDNIQPEIVSIVMDIFKSETNLNQVVVDKFPFMETYCESHSEFVFNEQGYTFAIPCSVISQNFDAIVEQAANSLAKDIYYREYTCEFWKCFEEMKLPFFVISKKAKDYWHNKFYLSLTISAILIILIFFLVEYKTNWPILVGSLLTISALPFMKLTWLLSLISNELFMKFFASFFTKSYDVFLIALTIGIIVLIIGIILKFFKIGFKVSNLLSKSKEKSKNISKEDVKKVVKQEVSKNKKESKSK